MIQEHRSRLEKYHLRARLPVIIRTAALTVLSAVLIIVGISFYLGSFRQEFRMKGLPTTLSDKVMAVVDGYERKESEDSVLQYLIKADKATTYEDNHQELENVFLEVYVNGDPAFSDKLRAEKAIYVPEGQSGKNFTIFFAGGVVIDTRDALKISTDQLTYTKRTETAEAEELVRFERENISGSAVGAVVRIEQKTLDLLADVEIFAGPGGADPSFQSPDVNTAEMRSGSAFVDQESGEIRLNDNVDVLVIPRDGSKSLEEPTRIRSSRATALVQEKQLRRIDLVGEATVDQKPGRNGKFTKASAERIVAHIDRELTGLEMFGGVTIESSAGKAPPAKISAKDAVYTKPDELFELTGGVRINAVAQGEDTVITSSEARYFQAKGKIFLIGGASIVQGTEALSGDRIDALLYEDRTIRSADVAGNATVTQNAPERASRMDAQRIKAEFSRSGEIKSAKITGGTEITVDPRNRSGYSRYALSTKSDVEMVFQNDGKPASAKSKGRTKITLTAADAGPNASDKTLEADSVSTVFRAGTDELEKAEALGNAILVIEPRARAAGKYTTEVRSPGFVCDFFSGNNARSCEGTGRSNARRIPFPGSGSRGVQTLDADKFVAGFDPKTQDIAKLDAVGNSKFNENDRNGTSERISYTENEQTVRLRGGDPVIWDDAGRIRASEIDWNIKTDKSDMRGDVSATYYGQRKARGATPFAKVNSPVFIASRTARFDHRAESALFSGDARAWQDKNYVRADSILLEQQFGRFYAEGNVRTLLYEAERTVGGKRSKQSVYAESGSVIYLSGDRLLRYAGKVDIRQGADRIRAETASVFLNEKNDLARTVAEKDVVITQPGRHATGDYASYDASAEVIVLRGDPATVRDEERGSSSGREVTVDLKDNVVVGTGKTAPSSGGRIRSVYKLKDGKLN